VATKPDPIIDIDIDESNADWLRNLPEGQKEKEQAKKPPSSLAKEFDPKK